MMVIGMVPVNLVHIPLLGMISAGYPSDQEQQSDRCVAIEEDMLQLPKNARTFALEVRGDSMIDAHIVAGDVVIMELRDPTHRDIVSALIDGETTLKRFLFHKGKPFLRAENPKYPDLIPAHKKAISTTLSLRGQPHTPALTSVIYSKPRLIFRKRQRAPTANPA